MAKKKPAEMNRAKAPAAKKTNAVNLTEIANEHFWRGFRVGLAIGCVATALIALAAYLFSLQ